MIEKNFILIDIGYIFDYHIVTNERDRRRIQGIDKGIG